MKVMFLIIGGVTDEPLTGTSSWVDSVWAFMTFKWALACLVHMFHTHFITSSTGFANI